MCADIGVPFRWGIVRLLGLGLFLFLVTAPVLARSPDAGAGAWIKVRTPYSTLADAYVAGPEKATVAVLVIPDIWGVNVRLTRWVDRMARLGMRALAIDLYDGRMVTDSAMAREVYGTIDPVWIQQDIKGGLAYLSQRFSTVVVMGWGQGAVHAVGLATAAQKDAGPGNRAGGNKLRAVVVYNDEQASAGPAVNDLLIPVLDVSTPHSLIDPFRPLHAKDLESTWQATELFLTQRLH